MQGPIVVFEDDRVGQLHPLTLTRPVFDLICGMFPLAEKLRRGLSAAGWDPGLHFHTRAYLASKAARRVESFSGLSSEVPGGDGLVAFVNGRLIWDDALPGAIDPGWTGRYMCGESVAWANVPASWLGRLDGLSGSLIGVEAFEDLPAKDLDAVMVSYPWDLIRLNGEELESDFARAGGGSIETDIPDGVYLVRASLEGKRLVPGLANLGFSPTFGAGKRRLEVHLLGRAGDLYGRAMQVSFERFLRPEIPFPDAEALAGQIAEDLRRARKHFEGRR